MLSDKLFLRITYTAIILAFVVVVLGAYTRLSDAGLGCPDWPGCYGKLVVPASASEIAESGKAYPERPLHKAKAWKEMIHRYAAGTLGLLILALAFVAWKRRSQPGQQIIMPITLLVLVIFQALLGMWTVTLLLKPIIVVAHLLGGMTILLLLLWLILNQNNTVQPLQRRFASGGLLRWAVIGLGIIYLQITLGGWTSANYAALICADFPVCQGQWWPAMNFIDGFTPWRGVGIDYEGGVLGVEARTAVHMAHRIGALITLIIVAAIALRIMLEADARLKRLGLILMTILLLQVSLGIANVVLFLPLAVAVAHNAVAALLLLATTTLLFYAKVED